jgi:hypothetical protein
MIAHISPADRQNVDLRKELNFLFDGNSTGRKVANTAYISPPSPLMAIVTKEN